MAGFWAGFGTQFSKDVGEIRKELREDSRSRKNYMDQYGAKTIANAQAKSDEILSMVNPVSSILNKITIIPLMRPRQVAPII